MLSIPWDILLRGLDDRYVKTNQRSDTPPEFSLDLRQGECGDYLEAQVFGGVIVPMAAAVHPEREKTFDDGLAIGRYKRSH
jgi:hypothetical protein